MDFAVAQLALIFLPGIIWGSIDAKYGTGLRPKEFGLILRYFLFGTATHAVLYGLYTVRGYGYGYSGVIGVSQAIRLEGFMDEIAFSIPLSLVLAVSWLYFVKNRLFMKFLHLIRATRRYGDEDVWSFTLNSSQPHVEYVHLRDLASGMTFAGWVNTYSENESIRELLLRDAIVYNEAGEIVSKAPHLYIARDKSNIWVDFPYRDRGEYNVAEAADPSDRQTD